MIREKASLPVAYPNRLVNLGGGKVVPTEDVAIMVCPEAPPPCFRPVEGY